MLLNILIVILSILVPVLVIFLIVKVCKGYGRKVKGATDGTARAENIGYLTMQAVTKGAKTRFVCSGCHKTYPNGTSRYKIIPVGGKYTIKSVCCDAVCTYIMSIETAVGN